MDSYPLEYIGHNHNITIFWLMKKPQSYDYHYHRVIFEDGEMADIITVLARYLHREDGFAEENLNNKYYNKYYYKGERAILRGRYVENQKDFEKFKKLKNFE